MREPGQAQKDGLRNEALSDLHDAGCRAAETWLAAHAGDVGARASIDVTAELTHRVLKAPAPSGT